MNIVDKDVFSLVLRYCWPQDFLSLALSCKKIRALMKERRFWLHFQRRLWPNLCNYDADERTDEQLMIDTIRMWRGNSYTYFMQTFAPYPIELARTIESHGGALIIEMRAPFDAHICSEYFLRLRQREKGRDNCMAAFKLTRIARRALAEVIEGGDITAFGDEIYVHGAFLLKPLLSLFKKKVVYPIGKRVKLMIFKKGKWLDSCRVWDGGIFTLLIDTRRVLKGLV